MRGISMATLTCLIMVICAVKMGESSVEVHIVYTERPELEDVEVFHLRTLSNVLGSEEAAKESMLYSYSTAACGFSARLTPDQVTRLSREPGILQVVPSQKYQLHGKSGNRPNSRIGTRML